MRNHSFKKMLSALLMLSGCIPSTSPPAASVTPVRHWAAYYGNKTPASAFKNLDLVVFDRRYHPDFKALQPRTTVLAYVSAGEVYDDVPEKNLLANRNLLLFQQDHWKSHAVDITAPQWRAMVMGYVDDAVSKGFDGVMLDTIDSPIEWSVAHAPERTDALQAAAALLISDIRARHPDIKIMLNRGFSLLPDVADKIDFMLAESILTHVNVSTGQFSISSPTSYLDTAEMLRQAAAASHLQVLTLDYWNQDDAGHLHTIYATQRTFGFAPYVTTADLRSYTPEPELPPPPRIKE